MKKILLFLVVMIIASTSAFAASNYGHESTDIWWGPANTPGQYNSANSFMYEFPIGASFLFDLYSLGDFYSLGDLHSLDDLYIRESVFVWDQDASPAATYKPGITLSTRSVGGSSTSTIGVESSDIKGANARLEIIDGIVTALEIPVTSSSKTCNNDGECTYEHCFCPEGAVTAWSETCYSVPEICSYGYCTPGPRSKACIYGCSGTSNGGCGSAPACAAATELCYTQPLPEDSYTIQSGVLSSNTGCGTNPAYLTLTKVIENKCIYTAVACCAPTALCSISYPMGCYDGAVCLPGFSCS